jgi:hypothetical protein
MTREPFPSAGVLKDMPTKLSNTIFASLILLTWLPARRTNFLNLYLMPQGLHP